LPNRLSKLFLSHPEALNETYVTHLRHAMSYSGRLLAAAFCAFAHGLMPFLFEKSASNAIKAMHGEMAARGAMQPGAQQSEAQPAK
jgi:hypothetical protein